VIVPRHGRKGRLPRDIERLSGFHFPCFLDFKAVAIMELTLSTSVRYWGP
jgi:hypothetical protein